MCVCVENETFEIDLERVLAVIRPAFMVSGGQSAARVWLPLARPRPPAGGDLQIRMRLSRVVSKGSGNTFRCFRWPVFAQTAHL